MPLAADVLPPAKGHNNSRLCFMVTDEVLTHAPRVSAGTNMLMVGVHGPKTPCEEVYVKHMGNRMYNVTYTVKEQGSYILIVKWGDENVPGSPFHVTVP